MSRNAVPSMWLSAAVPSKASTRWTRAAKTPIASRKSVSTINTINTDLFPELITWATVIEKQSLASCSQRIPTDVHSKREHDVDTFHEPTYDSASLSRILDPTSLEFGFDQSCLDGLDDCLAYSPLEAFEEVCWTQATYTRPDRVTPIAKPTVPAPAPTPALALKSTPQKVFLREPRSFISSGSDYDDSDTDSDDCATFSDNDVHLNIAHEGAVLSLYYPTADILTDKDEKTMFYGDEKRTSFIVFESTFPTPDPKTSVAFFPIPTLARKTVPKRIAAFCANIPSSLAFVRSPHTS